MQKVERRKHRGGRKRVWLAAAAVLLAGSVTAAVLLSRKPPAEPLTKEDYSGLLVSREAEELVSVTIERRGEEPWTLIRTENGELMPEGGEWTVSENQARKLTESLTQLRYEEILSEDAEVYREHPEDFGLKYPLVTVTGVYTDGKQVTLRIGGDTGMEESRRYMTVEGDDRLYAVSNGVAEDLDMEYALLHPVPKPEIYEALLDRITLTDREGGKIAEWQLRGKITDRDAGTNWMITAPFNYPADEEAISNLKKSAGNLRLGVYTAPATAENLEKYGLKQPEKTLEIHMAAGSTGTVGESGVYDVQEHDESTVRLYIGQARDEAADYVRYGEEIFTVSHFTLAALTDPTPVKSAARYPVLTPLASLESLTVEENGEISEYTLAETEESDTASGEGRECRLNGEKMEYSTFEAAYQRLLTVTFSGELPAGAAWKEPYKKYTFRTLSGGTHTVTLSDWDGVHDAVTVDGSTLFYLIKGGMTELPSAGQ